MKENQSKLRSLETIIILVIASLIVYWKYNIIEFLYLAFFLLIIGIIFRRIALLIHYLWMKLAVIISFFSTKIILSFIYYIILTPISFFYKLFNSKSLFSKPQSSNSNYIERNYQYSSKDIENPW
jgi:hypothetical protein